jgi:hypothetical protein
VPGNDAEELLPVAAFEKVIKTTITQAASPVTREDMGAAYKAAIPGATVTVSPRRHAVGGQGHRGHHPGGMRHRVPGSAAGHPR